MGNTNKKPSLDEQIAYITDKRAKSSGPEEVMYQEILENLLTIKLWMDNTEWHNINLIKVIEDLVNLIGDEQHPYIENAEAALGMLGSFKKSPKQ